MEKLKNASSVRDCHNKQASNGTRQNNALNSTDLEQEESKGS